VINIEKKKFDKEYSTSYRSEVEYLKSVFGIRFEFVKLINGISIYKYKKTPMLFKALESFYTLLENNSKLTKNEK